MPIFRLWNPPLFLIVGKKETTFFKTSFVLHWRKKVWSDTRVSKQWQIVHFMCVIPSSTSLCVDLYAWATVGSIVSNDCISAGPSTITQPYIHIPHLIVRCNLNLTFTIHFFFSHCTVVFTGNTTQTRYVMCKKKPITKPKHVDATFRTSETQNAHYIFFSFMMLSTIQTKITDGKCLSGQFFGTYYKT